MREIKFRAWNKRTKKMNMYVEIYCYKDGSTGYSAGIENNNPIGNSENFELMQFTGLKDKNGNEIYEGYVLKFVGGTCNFLPCGIYSDQKHKIGAILVLKKLLSGFTLQRTNNINDDIPNLVGNVDNYTFWNHQRSFEVIGNIYENPELLL